MNKLQEVKEAIKNTPPDRLAKIEFQSHFLQMVGVSTVCIFLILKGFWYIIFAFIFSLGISYSQGVGAYQKYKFIRNTLGPSEYKPEEDKSFTRRRDYINKSVFGLWGKIFCFTVSIALSLVFIPYNTWYFKVLFAFAILGIYYTLYFRMMFYLANKIYKEDKNNEKEKRTI